MTKSSHTFNRRNFIKGLGAGATAVGAGSLLPFTACSVPSSSEGKTKDEGPVLQIGEQIAVADTDRGKVKGFIMRGVYTFLGIPYGADTTGKNRFMPPVKHEPWEGVRPAVFYGNSAPQNIYDRSTTSYGAFIDHWNYDEVSENCLTINVWTNGLADGKKRPVIVWLHGGGYTSGNGIEQDGYHGENIARHGDVVYCSINHRLGVFGFSDLSTAGEKYKDSGNVGLLDMVAALEWVHDNIANFGGDPGNVTIIGQSGGGGKVCILAACPQAKGLVHKGVALSGSSTSGIAKDYARKLGEYILKEAGLAPSTADKLQDLPWRDYLDLANRAARKMREEQGDGGRRGGFGPVADGVHLPEGTFFEAPLPDSPDLPMLFCTTFHEQSPSRTDAAVEGISLEEVTERLKARYPDKAEAIVQAYARNFPDAKPVELLALITSNRQAVVHTATAKSKQNSPLWMAWFGWCPPLFDGRMRAFHCLDISFWFLNTDLMVTHSGGGTRPRRLSLKMADALVSFAQTGDPNGGGGLPSWPPFTVDQGETMILNDVCEVKNDPDKEARSSLA
jgi:para-nitrobenzyl esterase